MHKAIAVTQDTWWVGVNDYGTDLFESLWPLPQGVAYNAYVILGDKTVAIDTVKGPRFDEYLDKVLETLNGRPLDYLVVNHMEPDHAGLVAHLKRTYPNLQIIGNAKTLPLLKGYHHIEKDVVQVKDGEKLDTGGHELFFYVTPMVHWPESMTTFDATTKTLFSNDAFGGYGAHEGGLFDDVFFDAVIAFQEGHGFIVADNFQVRPGMPELRGQSRVVGFHVVDDEVVERPALQHLGNLAKVIVEARPLDRVDGDGFVAQDDVCVIGHALRQRPQRLEQVRFVVVNANPPGIRG